MAPTLTFKPGVQERYDEVDWEHPDYDFLYHQLLYEVLPYNIIDKRTNRKAHEEAIAESRRMRDIIHRLSKDIMADVTDLERRVSKLEHPLG